MDIFSRKWEQSTYDPGKRIVVAEYFNYIFIITIASYKLLFWITNVLEVILKEMEFS